MKNIYIDNEIDLKILVKIELSQFRTLFYDIAIDGVILHDKDKTTGMKLIKNYQKRIKKKV
ncbi:MAG: hypothetical protein ACTSXH_17340 [Promethearchaeota archaeon]